jgi:hypothetical protein
MSTIEQSRSMARRGPRVDDWTIQIFGQEIATWRISDGLDLRSGESHVSKIGRPMRKRSTVWSLPCVDDRMARVAKIYDVQMDTCQIQTTHFQTVR